MLLFNWASPCGPGCSGLRFRSVCRMADRFAPCTSLTRNARGDCDPMAVLGGIDPRPGRHGSGPHTSDS